MSTNTTPIVDLVEDSKMDRLVEQRLKVVQVENAVRASIDEGPCEWFDTVLVHMVS